MCFSIKIKSRNVPITGVYHIILLGASIPWIRRCFCCPPCWICFALLSAFQRHTLVITFVVTTTTVLRMPFFLVVVHICVVYACSAHAIRVECFFIHNIRYFHYTSCVLFAWNRCRSDITGTFMLLLSVILWVELLSNGLEASSVSNGSMTNPVQLPPFKLLTYLTSLFSFLLKRLRLSLFSAQVLRTGP